MRTRENRALKIELNTVTRFPPHLMANCTAYDEAMATGNQICISVNGEVVSSHKSTIRFYGF